MYRNTSNSNLGLLSNIGSLFHRQPANAMTVNREEKFGWIRKMNYEGRDSGMEVV